MSQKSEWRRMVDELHSGGFGMTEESRPGYRNTELHDVVPALGEHHSEEHLRAVFRRLHDDGICEERVFAYALLLFDGSTLSASIRVLAEVYGHPGSREIVDRYEMAMGRMKRDMWLMRNTNIRAEGSCDE